MSFCDLFLSKLEKNNGSSSPFALNLCSGCLNLMMQSALCGTCCRESNKPCFTHEKSAEDPLLTPTRLIELLNQNKNGNEQEKIIFNVVERNVRRKVYTEEELSQANNLATVSSENNNNDIPNCHACLGLVSNVNNSTLTLARAVRNSPYKDSSEISFCTTVAPILCLHWDTVYALFVECCSKVTSSLNPNLVHCYLEIPPKNKEVVAVLETKDNQDDAAAAEGKTIKKHVSPRFAGCTWRPHKNISEDFLQGGLRLTVVNEMRNCSLESCLPPPLVQNNNNNNVDSSASPAPLAWKYGSQGSGNGIVCDISFQNPSLFQIEQRGIYTSTLLQHDGVDATWDTLLKEVAPNVFEFLLISHQQKRNTEKEDHDDDDAAATTAENHKVVNTSVTVGIRHEPLFFYGRYRKFSRTMSQSPWFAKGGQRVSKELSLQEEIANKLIHSFFPGKNLEELNMDYARTDARLYDGRKNAAKFNSANGVSSTGNINKNYSNNNNNAQASTAYGRNGTEGVSLAKLEIREARGSLNAPSRRQREEGDDNENENDQEEDADNLEQDSETTNVANSQQKRQFDTTSPAAILGVLPHFRTTFNNVYCFSLYRFHAGGREDVDVRMLGNGRPFVLEVMNPHKQCFTQEELDELAQNFCKTSEAIEIDSLAVVGRSIMGELQEDAEGKKKAYRCVCYSQRPMPSRHHQDQRDALLQKIKSQLPLVLDQRTPTRVLHRRSNLIRKKKIYGIDIEFLNEHWMVVDLLTQAGTYVKEFCHGDMGRTFPYLGTLLESPFTDIIQLDVKMLIHSNKQKLTRNADGHVVDENDEKCHDDDDDEGDDDDSGEE